VTPPIQVSEVDPKPGDLDQKLDLDKIVIEDTYNSTNGKNSSNIKVVSDDYEYKEVEEGL